ncbi:MAG: HAMP domain-containing histidine kinase [Planctomycetes bacterium]|nr:HAMP domain-containing histidine kinase [Planctomycetota bacterium]MBT4029316.1 HAMP domain-containing histidine kinase [Planctomycetota bacterium]MBT4561301.1 HAMP domain-containing histidine kinase [Planctomycetota bacterium]MBT5101397.1 HAMP domain-containing histidine kinase [Planctomycetota bacterium]MBT5120341.1 HAMP domain-containing histidine kinase [Planctomycetota bacterium]
MKTGMSFWAILLATLFLLQLGWWGALIMRLSGEMVDARFFELDAEQIVAERALEDAMSAGAPLRESWSQLAPLFPEFALVAGNTQHPLKKSRKTLAALHRARMSYRNMVFGEATLFFILTMLGLAFFLRTLRHEKFLALQHQNFLHAVTHEFRSPLQSLRLAIETLQRRPDPKRATVYASGMIEDVDRLTVMVQNMLDVGRIEASAFEAKPRQIILSDALKPVLERWRQTHIGQSPVVIANLPQEVTADVDPATIEPILRNLLDNALKYGEGNEIHVTLAQGEAAALLSVRDFGRGLARDELQHVFKRFWRAGDERVRTAPGSGIGLFLVQELIQAQNGRINAESDGLEKGACFTVTWPSSAEAT